MDFTAAAQRVVFSNYTVEFTQDGRYVEMRRALLKHRAEILEKIYNLTGLPYPSNFGVQVNFMSVDNK